MSVLSASELVEIKKIFDKYDTNDNGVIDWTEFCNMVDDLDVTISLNDRTIIFDKIDSNHSGMINIEEFVECWKVEE
jgi:Ca2+-binding EF-hand superfamily protein